MKEDKPDVPNPAEAPPEEWNDAVALDARQRALGVADVDKAKLTPSERAHFEKVYEATSANKLCQDCGGSGKVAEGAEDQWNERECTACDGTGWVPEEEWLLGEPVIREVPWPEVSNRTKQLRLPVNERLLQVLETFVEMLEQIGILDVLADDDANEEAREMMFADGQYTIGWVKAMRAAFVEAPEFDLKPIEVGEVIEACAKVCEALAKPYADARLETFDFGAKNRLSSLESMAEKCADEIRKHKVTIEQKFNPISQKIESETVTIEEVPR